VAGVKYSPTNVAVAPNGDIYIADGYGSSFINQYDAGGRYLRTFGGKGSVAGQLDCPHGLIVDERGAEPVLLVADRGNRRLQSFTLDGRHLACYGGFTAPCHFHANGRVMVVPDLFARVTLIDSGNAAIAHLGDNGTDSWKPLRAGPRDGFPPGKFVCPHSATFDRAGNIFVVEWVEVGRVTRLRRV
jgi:DNA-binding beta-propeller fold protein YncE